MLTLLLDDQLYLSPIDKHCHGVINLGCGTGIWTLDFADTHPSAEVVGVNSSPIQPTWVAPICRFVIDDCECEWAYPPDYFDFVYIRCLYGSVSDWSALYRQIYNHIKPGGFIEQVEMSVKFISDGGAADSNDVMAEWSQIFIDAGERMVKSFEIADQVASHIRDAGFVDVVERWCKVPVGSWPKDKQLREIGWWNYHFCREGFEGWALYLLTRLTGWKVPEVHILVARMKSTPNNRIHCYYHV